MRRKWLNLVLLNLGDRFKIVKMGEVPKSRPENIFGAERKTMGNVSQKRQVFERMAFNGLRC